MVFGLFGGETAKFDDFEKFRHFDLLYYCILRVLSVATKKINEILLYDVAEAIVAFFRRSL